MATIPIGLFGGTSDKARQAEIKNITADVITQPKPNRSASSTDEVYQWQIRCTLYTENLNVKRFNLINGLIPVIGYVIKGSFRGGDDVSIKVDSDYFSQWRCVSQSLTGIEATGSEIVAHEQQYVCESGWLDAPWNDEI